MTRLSDHPSLAFKRAVARSRRLRGPGDSKAGEQTRRVPVIMEEPRPAMPHERSALDEEMAHLRRMYGRHADGPKLEFHPYANIFSRLTGKPLDDLAASITKHGFHEQVVLAPDGRVLVGVDHVNACIKAGVPIRAVQWDGKGSMLTFTLERQLRRPQPFSPSQLGLAGGRLADLRSGHARPSDGPVPAVCPKLRRRLKMPGKLDRLRPPGKWRAIATPRQASSVLIWNMIVNFCVD